MGHGNEVHQITKSGNSLNGTLINEDDPNNLSNLNNPAPITQDAPDNFSNYPHSNNPGSITKDEPDNLSNINNPASVTRDELDNFSNNPPSDDPDSITEDEPSNTLNLNNPPQITEYDQRHNLLNSNDHPSITEIEPDDLLDRRDLPISAVEVGGPSNNPDRLNLINDHPSHNEVLSMGRKLLKAALSGDSNELKKLLLQDPNVNLLGPTSGSTCPSDAEVAENLSVLSSINSYGETPLIVAVTRGHVSLAYALLKHYQQLSEMILKQDNNRDTASRQQYQLQLSEMILRQDNNRDTALHHAIRNGYKDLAIKLIQAEPSLSERVNKYDESPMYIAVLRGFNGVSGELLKIPSSSDKGAFHENALHAAVRSGNPDIAKDIVMARPSLAREENESGNTPMHLCVLWNKLDVIRVLLQYDPSFGYLINSHTNAPLLVSAAFRGNIDVAKEILKYCPDAPYCRQDGWTMLHEAICQGHEAFVEFILETPDQRHNLINRKDIQGETALHIAVTKCNPKVVRSLMAHKAILDLTVVSKRGDAPESSLMSDTMKLAKTLDRNDVMKIMEILDYEGLAWEDRKFLLHYRSLTEKLMWFAYMATTVAFATGLYTVLKPRITWLAILICLLPIVPFLTYLLGKWPIWKLRWRLGSAYKSDLLDLLDMV
ncbi:Ankyrin repeat family protein [Rhynchospora pubera]|uniref:Ankyrin repeat family protein n=1 Tax=Rhynchospora pubera TaxID=906938 RepID=A0AAV8FMJ1_9POAL|nr:Ankyrin repeat family protein [Rhynchospora pubera]